MRKPAKPVTNQMKLSSKGEWFGSGSVWNGKEVFLAMNRRSEKWLSDCSLERALTKGLMDRVADLSNLSKACRRVVVNRGSPGIDGMRTSELGAWLSSNWKVLQSDLLTGSYTPSAVLGVEIPKPGGGHRQLGIPTVKDRLVQQAIHQVLSPRYEDVFSSSSHGFRRGRSAHGALSEACFHVSSGHNVIVDLDLAKFFDEVNHDRLLWLLGRRIGDSRLLTLIGRFLRSGLLQEGLVSQKVKGTPQGGPLSPLLSNIVLDELDKELERRGHRFVRYADDIVIFVRSRLAGERVLSSISNYIEKRLHLKVNHTKSGVRGSSEVNFLGHSLLIDGTLGLSRESERKLKNKVRFVTRRNRGISFARMLQELNLLLRGWLNYFYLARMGKKIKALMSWVRRRLRCFRLKQCKRAIGISRFLRKQGVSNRRSWTVAASRRGWWRKSGTPAATEGMSLKWFNEMGLYDLSSAYLVKHPKKPPYTRVRTVV